mgnify:CR=1 FL=1|jgi:hypothetical protein
MVEKFYSIVVTSPLGGRGFAPALSDIEIITMQIVGEFLELDFDKNIWMYFKNNWLEWFPKLGSYPNFCKHCVNLWHVKFTVLSKFSNQFRVFA